MSFRTLAEALLAGRPYFGPALCAMQGVPERHQYFLPVVANVARRRGGPLEVLEIGSWAGASTISWALALRETGAAGTVTCVDPWVPYFDSEYERARHYRDMNSAARDGLIALLFEHNLRSAGVDGMVRQHRDYSRNVLPGLPAGQFDVIYIDGSHRFEDVCFDIREAKRLLREDGVICGDDLELEAAGLPAGELAEAIAGGMDYVPSPADGPHYHPGVTGAVAEEFRAVGVWDGFWAVRSRNGDWVPPDLDLRALRMPAHIDRRQGQLRLVGSTATHNFIEGDGAYFGLLKSLGPVELFHEQLGERELAPLVLIGATLDEVQRKSQENQPPAAEEPEIPVLAGSHGEFNLITYQGRTFALRQSLGPVNVSEGEFALRQRFRCEDFLVAADEPTARTAIDHLEQICRAGDAAAGLERSVSDLRAELVGMKASLAADAERRSRDLADLRDHTESYRQEYLADSTELHDMLEVHRVDFGSECAQLRNLFETNRQELQSVSAKVRETLGDSDIYVKNALNELALRADVLARKQDLVSRQVDLMQYGPGSPEIPCAAGEHLGFHLVYYRGRVYALRQPLDLNDLKRGEQQLLATCNPDDVVVGETVDGIRARLEMIEALRELRAGMAALDREILQTRSEMSEGLKELDSVAQGHTDALDRLRRRWPLRVFKD